jgi:hypothetical protein
MHYVAHMTNLQPVAGASAAVSGATAAAVRFVFQPAFGISLVRPASAARRHPALASAEQPPVLSWALRSAPEARDDFDMRRMAKLIDRLDPRYFIAAGA